MVVCILPILAVGPIITLYVLRHDTAVHFMILYVFVSSLMFAVCYVGSQWVDWCSSVVTVNDVAVKDWYIQEKADGRHDAFVGVGAPAA